MISKSQIKRLAILQEANLKECKICKQKKLRILYGKYPSMNNKYVDEAGGLWSGRICAPCNKARVKAKMQEIRANRKENRNIGEELIQSVQEMVDAEKKNRSE